MTSRSGPSAGPVEEAGPAGSTAHAETEVVEQLEAMEVEETNDSPVWLLALVPEWTAALALIGLTAAVTVGVIVRYNGNGITGIVEGAGISMVVIVLLSTSALAMRDGHVRLELIDALLRPRALKAVNIFSRIVQILVVAFLCYAMYQAFMTDMSRGTSVPGDVDWPRMYISGLALVCFVILGLSLLRMLARDLRSEHSSVLSRGSDGGAHRTGALPSEDEGPA